MQLILRHCYSWGRRVLGALISVTRSHWLAEPRLDTALQLARPHDAGVKAARSKSTDEGLSDRIFRLPSRVKHAVKMDTELDTMVDINFDKMNTICYIIMTYMGHKCGHMRRHILG